jgi:tRNA threonylcarbamoyladenosine modification (KEOPS) complex Cgi121 subunit
LNASKIAATHAVKNAIKVIGVHYGGGDMVLIRHRCLKMAGSTRGFCKCLTKRPISLQKQTIEFITSDQLFAFVTA